MRYLRCKQTHSSQIQSSQTQSSQTQSPIHETEHEDNPGHKISDLATGRKETYTGLTDGTMRDRISKHESNSRHRDQTGTRLSAHVWEIKDMNHPYTIKWRILSRASSYNPTTGMCRLCLKEKFMIMFCPATASLNQRSEIYSSCRHRKGKLLEKT